MHDSISTLISSVTRTWSLPKTLWGQVEYKKSQLEHHQLLPPCGRNMDHVISMLHLCVHAVVYKLTDTKVLCPAHQHTALHLH